MSEKFPNVIVKNCILMSLYTNIFYYLVFCTIYLSRTTSKTNRHLVVTRSGVDEVKLDSIGLKFVCTLENNSDKDFYVEFIPDECCIDFGEPLDCNSVQIIGECSEVIGPGKTETFTLVAPVLDPFERKGYCSMHVDSRPIDKRSDIMRDTIKINFTTNINNKETVTPDGIIKKCKNKDEDPLNDCKPVDCDTYYNGKKPIYDKKLRRCIEPTKHKSYSENNTVYDSLTDLRDVTQIVQEDLDFIQSLVDSTSHNVDKINQASPRSTVHRNATSKHESRTAEFTTNINKTDAFRSNFVCIQKYLTANKYTVVVLGTVILIQCCLICTMIYFLTKRSICSDKKKVERKYFNYRQDMSVTTPLIPTSNIETETMEYDFVSETSNPDNKIKCYKACQKDREENPKMSMSDDILSKCLNRRNWNAKTRSDTNDVLSNCYDRCTNVEYVIQKDKPDEKVVEINVIEPNEAVQEVKAKNFNGGSSEKVIQFYDYHLSHKNFYKKKTPSESTEKGAQACFSNDSIDDYLSERGMTVLAADNLSKYSFSSNSVPTSATGKSSKKNFIKTVLSYLSRNSRCTSSDPGSKKSKSKDVEIIHMSKVSMCSSSASEYKLLKGAVLAKEPRTF